MITTHCVMAGTRAVEASRAAHPEVTAVAAFDDDIARRVLTALHDLGLPVPDAWG